MTNTFTLSAEDYKKLRRAELLLAEVQCPMKENWQRLYSIRCDLGREVFNRRPENWAELEGLL